jgi:hypothetical protein
MNSLQKTGSFFSNKTMVPTLTTSVQHSAGSSSQDNQARKRNKSLLKRKRRRKITCLHTQ